MMNFIDLAKQQLRIRDKIDTGIQRVLAHGRYVMGPEINEMETKLAEFVGVKHAIAVSSGTDALLIAMMALDIKPGDEVITTPFTFFATGEMILQLHAKPVFVDIDPRTYNIDVNQIEAAITDKTKAIMPVGLYGQTADMKSLNIIAKKHNIPVIEDAAQSFGATHHDETSCNLSTIGCTSFFPSKPLACYGDGGACFTNDDYLAQAMREILNHGQSQRYTHTRLGLNGRMDTIQAAILLAKLDIFPDEIEKRQSVAAQYSELMNGSVTTPYIAQANTSVFAQYTIRVSDRTEFCKRLQAHGIPTAIHYPVPFNKQPIIKTLLPDQIDYPNAELAAAEVVSLPMHPYLSTDEIQRVAEAVLGAMSVASLHSEI